MLLQTLLDALQQAVLFIPLTLGIYLSYRILAITDLTPDGTFVLGAAIFAHCLSTGHSEIISIIFALFGGALAGIAVCLLQRYAKINSLLASILAVFMLTSINFAVMGLPNINLLNYSTTLNNLQSNNLSHFNMVLISMALLLTAGMFLLINSRFGLRLRAFGANKTLLAKLGKYPTIYLAFGLALSNMLAALCGVFTAQVNGYADIHMGVGMALTGIGAVVIGCKLTSSLFLRNQHFSLLIDLIGCFIGTYIYFLIVNLFLLIGLNPIYLKLFLGLVLVLFLSSASYSKKNYQKVLFHD
jgi:putative tryptophan/tyrosine transport system permease protein